jgi:hypothetical protein
VKASAGRGERWAAFALLACGVLGWSFLQHRVADSDAALAARRTQLEQLRVLVAVPNGSAGALDAVVGLLDGRPLRWSERDGIGYLLPEARP